MKYLITIERFFDRHPGNLYLSVFLLFALVRIFMLQWDPIGLPDDHDEFAYLLQAEIFAEGRFHFPQHPMWEHFESFHILLSPVYASKYPPGQAFFMYLGIKFFGHPWYGVLLSCMIMATALVWMVRGYFSTRWAIIAGIFIIIRFALWNYWSSSYWGGAVAATGGALVFGALPRLSKTTGPRQILASVCLGLGLLFLTMSRPMEGMLVSIIPGFYFLNLTYQRFRQQQVNQALRIFLPTFLLLIINFSLIGFYNYKVTGDALTMPYRLHTDQYQVQPPFLFVAQREQVPEYNHELFEQQYNGWELVKINTAKDYRKIKRRHFRRFMNYHYYWPVVVMLCIFFIDRKGLEVPFWSFILFSGHIAFTSWFHPHYFAPALGIYYLLLIKSIIFLTSDKNEWVRKGGTVAIAILLILTLVNANFFANRHPGYINGTEEYIKKKYQIINELEQTDQGHLILVKYNEDHLLQEEWVYNPADIDGSKVLWARYRSPDKTEELIEYFQDRKIWMINPDQRPVKLLPYNQHYEDN